MCPDQVCLTLSIRPSGMLGMLLAVCPRYSYLSFCFYSICCAPKGRGCFSLLSHYRWAFWILRSLYRTRTSILSSLPGVLISTGSFSECLFIDHGLKLSSVFRKPPGRTTWTWCPVWVLHLSPPARWHLQQTGSNQEVTPWWWPPKTASQPSHWTGPTKKMHSPLR